MSRRTRRRLPTPRQASCCFDAIRGWAGIGVFHKLLAAYHRRPSSCLTVFSSSKPGRMGVHLSDPQCDDRQRDECGDREDREDSLACHRTVKRLRKTDLTYNQKPGLSSGWTANHFSTVGHSLLRPSKRAPQEDRQLRLDQRLVAAGPAYSRGASIAPRRLSALPTGVSRSRWRWSVSIDRRHADGKSGARRPLVGRGRAVRSTGALRLRLPYVVAMERQIPAKSIAPSHWVSGAVTVKVG